MTKFIGVVTVVTFTLVAIVAWSNASVRSDGALRMSEVTGMGIDVLELARRARGLPMEEFPGF